MRGGAEGADRAARAEGEAGAEAVGGTPDGRVRQQEETQQQDGCAARPVGRELEEVLADPAGVQTEREQGEQRTGDEQGEQGHSGGLQCGGGARAAEPGAYPVRQLRRGSPEPGGEQGGAGRPEDVPGRRGEGGEGRTRYVQQDAERVGVQVARGGVEQHAGRNQQIAGEQGAEEGAGSRLGRGGGVGGPRAETTPQAGVTA
ncbi:hypothetical protein STRMOE7_23745 [Streptomyces sp. MOE7]|nr:hypothetical protein STRMOE7_23745 [Streptomyces sp. MOE7]